MDAASYARFTALLAVMATFGAVVLVVLRSRLADGFSIRMALSGGLAVAAASTVGSLVYSEVYHFEPCRLCWYQRIAMYPLVLILAVALIRSDRSVWRYVMSLAAAGAVVSVYHLLVQWTPTETTACVAGVPCSVRYVEEFGFVTIPFMALAGFATVMAFMWLAATLRSGERVS